MNVEFFSDRVATDQRGFTLEDVYRTIENLFAAHGFPCIFDDGAPAFEDKGHGDDFAVMWDIILSLLRSDWFLDCAASCVWEDENDVENVLSQARETWCSVRQQPAGNGRLVRQFQSLYHLEKAPLMAGLRSSPPGAVRAQVQHFDVKTLLAGKLPRPQCHLRAVTFRQRYRKVRSNLLTRLSEDVPNCYWV